MSNGFIITGLLIGDEGKGSTCDYIASLNNVKFNVRHNGGAQAAHTVINGKYKHKFSQLGSSFMNNDVKTYLSENTVVNPFNLFSEASAYSDSTKLSIKYILSRVYLSEQAKVVTPYHGLINKVRELSRSVRQGSTGAGVSEVRRVEEETGLVLTMKDLMEFTDETITKLRRLHEYTHFFVKEREDLIDPKSLKKEINKEDITNLTHLSNTDYIIKCYSNMMSSGFINVISSFSDLYTSGNVIFEGSQGVMLDYTYGIKPNTTTLDTTSAYAFKLCNDINVKPHSIGCVSIYNSRHGEGPLPTFDEMLCDYIFDENQVPSLCQGVPRYGWLDLVMLRYTTSISKTDEIILTMLDRLNGLDEVRICKLYRYRGIITDEFIKTFEFIKEGNEVIITNINSNEYLKKYLLEIEPIYKTFKGYTINSGFIPDELFEIIDFIEKEINNKIGYLSYGPDRSMKMRMKK